MDIRKSCICWWFLFLVLFFVCLFLGFLFGLVWFGFFFVCFSFKTRNEQGEVQCKKRKSCLWGLFSDISTFRKNIFITFSNITWSDKLFHLENTFMERQNTVNIKNLKAAFKHFVYYEVGLLWFRFAIFLVKYTCLQEKKIKKWKEKLRRFLCFPCIFFLYINLILKIKRVAELSVGKYTQFVVSTLARNYMKYEKWSYKKQEIF